MSRPRVAVVAHSAKQLGGGLGAFRQALGRAGVADPLWFEIAKSKQAPECAQQAVAKGADVLFAWGGDGTVQRCLDAIAGTQTSLAIAPAGTANLLATNLGIPTDLDETVEVGLHGQSRRIDSGTVNGEHFAVMAGAGFDALMLDEADSGIKQRIGRAAYVWAGARNLDAEPVHATIDVEGRDFFRGAVTCVLFGNFSRVGGGIELFEGAAPDDGLLELGVVSARNGREWLRTIGRTLVGRAEASPFVTIARGTSMHVTFDRPTVYELDGGTRKTVKKLTVKMHPSSIAVRVPGGIERESGASDA